MAIFIIGCWLVSRGGGAGGLVFIVLALARGFAYSGVELDLGYRRFRRFVTLFGLKIGFWEPLPVIASVTIKYFSEIQTKSLGEVGHTRKEEHQSFVVLLTVQDSTQGIILDRFDLEQRDNAEAFAQAIADYLSVSVRYYGMR